MKQARWQTGLGLALAAWLGCGCGPREAAPGHPSTATPEVGQSTPAPSPSARAIEAMNRGVAFMGHYQYDSAVGAFTEVLEEHPELVEARLNLAIARFNRGQREEEDIERSLEQLEAVLAVDPGNVRALYFKGIVLQHIGQAEEAVPLFEEVVRQRPDDGVAWYLLGLCRQRINEPATDELLKAVELRPYLYSAWYKLFQVAVAAGEQEAATRYMARFKQLRESPLGESIELPQYNQMGDLALVLPFPRQTLPPITRSLYRPGQPRLIGQVDPPAADAVRTGGVAAGDFNGDGRPDLLIHAAGRLRLGLAQPDGTSLDATGSSGLEAVRDARAVAVGDFDNDEIADLFVAGVSRNFLFRGRGDGTFEDVTTTAGLSGAFPGAFALFLDADHDADLDLILAGAGTTGEATRPALQLWHNNHDGTFTRVTGELECPGDTLVAVLPADLDGDRDTDLVLLRTGGPARVFLNDLLGRYRELPGAIDARGDRGGVLQDFNGDGIPDLLVLGGDPPALALWLGKGDGRFVRHAAFDEWARAAASHGAIQAFRVADVDLDGDLDIAVFTPAGHLLLNDGLGRFVLQPGIWPAPDGELLGLGWLDVTGDFLPDLVQIVRPAPGPIQILLASGSLEPPATGLAVAPTGVRGRDQRTRSPATGYGVKLTLRAGLREQVLLHQGLNGAADQSWVPVPFGLAGLPHADYLHLLWPDGVAQVETGLAAGHTHRLTEIQRKVSSCPVLFAWNGERFAFVTDFAGVGGLGYFVVSGEYAPPQVEEHVKIEPDQLVARDGVYELRITEPMEEVAYVDRLELRAVDHPAGWSVFPDERLALSGPKPTHELLVVRESIFPVAARGPEGADCLAALRAIDRRYAYQPRLDRRFIGFCEPHSLELDFDDALADLAPDERLFLFIQGFIEFPYSSTVYAAGQAQVGWEPIRIEARRDGDDWRTVVPDAGAPGGMARMMTVDLTGRVHGARALRLTTNLEIYYDQIFLARVGRAGEVAVRSLPMLSADLRRVGFALEFSPDGRLPLLYDYDLTEASAPFHVQRGTYTRYGCVLDLLEAFDDRYVLVGPGDEIAVRFDAATLPAPPPGHTRSFVLVSHAYCKDMDLYTATPQTVEPLPFRGMTRYPYPADERFPDTPEIREWKQAYNTRRVP